MSQALKIGIGEAIGLGRPLVEARERIIGRAAIRFRQNHMVAFDPVGDLVAFADPQGIAHRQRDRRLRLAGQLARPNQSSLSALTEMGTAPLGL